MSFAMATDDDLEPQIDRDPEHRGIDASALGWYALRVPANREFVAAQKLERRGYAAFVPIEFHWRRVNRYAACKEQRKFPLLVRYVLVGFVDDLPPWLEVFRLSFIESVVGGEIGPWRIDWSLIRVFLDGDPVRRRVAPTIHRHMRSGHEFNVGDDCEVIAGAFKGQIIKVEGIFGAKARGVFANVAAMVGVELPVDILEKR